MRTPVRLVCIVAAVASAMGVGGASVPKALVVMLDGMRADTVDNGFAPNIKRLADGQWQSGYHGAWSLCASTIRDGTTESAPNHVGIATGMTVKKSGIDWNPDLVHKGTSTRKLPTWLARLKRPTTIYHLPTTNYHLPTTNCFKALHIFSWSGDLHLSPDYGVQFIFDRDKANVRTLTKMMVDADAPDAIMWYIDLPDEAGHGYGYYPYAPEYQAAVRESDAFIGEVLAAIAARPTFANEDWLIVITADHGGWDRFHGQQCTQCYTIPFIVAGRNVTQGQIPGVPHNYDAAPTALAHFGVDVSKIDFDGQARGNGRAVSPRPPQTLADGLAVYLPFSDGAMENRGAAADVMAELRGKAAVIADGAAGGALRVSAATNSAGSVCLKGSERLKFEKGAAFAFAVWVRTFGPQVGDPLVFGNKNWEGGSNPGIALIASKGVDMRRVSNWNAKKRCSEFGFMFNCGRVGQKREDLGAYNPDFGQWTFYAATRDADGVVRFYQGRRDGCLYCVADDLSDIAFDTGLPFFIGQDGRGAYRHPFVGDVDEFAIWTRTLSHEEVRHIYEAGLIGKELSTLIKKMTKSLCGSSRRSVGDQLPTTDYQLTTKD